MISNFLQDGCKFVAVILHYLFLCAFCWMLCEGILLYLLLRVVFSEMAKTWWPFLLIGYGIKGLTILLLHICFLLNSNSTSNSHHYSWC